MKQAEGMRILVNEEALRDYFAKDAGCYRKDVARQLKIHPSYISHLLAGRRQPSPPVRKQLMDLTGLSFDALFRVILPENEEKPRS